MMKMQRCNKISIIAIVICGIIYGLLGNVNCVKAELNNGVYSGNGVYAVYDNYTGTLTIDKGTSSKMDDFSVGETVPWSADNIRQIIIKEGVTHIGDNAFANCSTLKKVTVEGNGLESIGRRAFYNCNALETVQYPASLKEIGAYAFYGCSSLQAADMSKTAVEKLKMYTFGECYNITSMKLPEKLSYIGDYCFEACNRIQTIDFAVTISYVGICAFSECTEIKNINFVNDSVKLSIDTFAFIGCTSLKTVELPKTIESVGDECFSECTSLNYVSFLGKPKYVGKDLFRNGNKNGTIIYSYAQDETIYTPSADENVQYVKGQLLNEQNVSVKLEYVKTAYNGAEQTPAISIFNKAGQKVSPDYYTIQYSNNKNAGTAVVTITGKGLYNGVLKKTFDIEKATYQLVVKDGKKQARSKYTLILNKNKKLALSVTTSGDEAVRISSSDEEVATVSADGCIVPKSAGAATITICANNPDKSNYKSIEKTIVVKVRKKQAITVKNKNRTYDYSKGKKISLKASAKGKTKLTYKSSNKRVMTIDQKGRIKIKGVGKAKITISAKENNTYAATKKVISYVVRPTMENVRIGYNSSKFRVTISNPTPNATLCVELYASPNKKKKYGKTRTMKLGKDKEVIKDIDVSQYDSYYPVIYLKKNGVKSQIITYKYGTITK